MKLTIPYATIVKEVARMCIQASCLLPPDVRTALEAGRDVEASPLGRSILDKLVENADLAAGQGVPICQDTGVAVFFVELGEDVAIEGGSLKAAIQEGTEAGYREGYLRKSVVRDPLFDRVNTKTNTPAVIHVDLVPGDGLRITHAPKGGGSENMSALAMLKPLQGKAAVTAFVVETVRKAGGNPCPPVVVGVGLGGTFEVAPYLAKKALLREIGSRHPDPAYADYERELLEAVNATGVGPEGLGGRFTAMAVHIETHPCHIASLPVAVNLNCHAARHAAVDL
ncbi:MAG TPA: fumarate hydratase [Holophaga sp.]|nr:fumarate hydratase [Holophaga sp.]